MVARPSKTAIRSYEDLRVWRAATELALAVYRVSTLFPANEEFGLRSQARRAAVSIASNIAEGHGREHRGDYIRHLSIARGSLMELRTQLYLAGKLFPLPDADLGATMGTAEDVSRMLSGLLNSLRSRS